MAANDEKCQQCLVMSLLLSIDNRRPSRPKTEDQYQMIVPLDEVRPILTKTSHASRKTSPTTA